MLLTRYKECASISATVMTKKIFWKEYCRFARIFWQNCCCTGFITSPQVLSLPITFVDTTICSNMLIFGGMRPCCGGLHFFFFQPVAGLTNQVLVLNCQARAPLDQNEHVNICRFPRACGSYSHDIVSIQSLGYTFELIVVRCKW